MTQDELEDAVWIAILEHSPKVPDSNFELLGLCSKFNITADEDKLVAFVNSNQGPLGSGHYMTDNSIYFDVTAEGFRHAKAIQERTKSKKLSNRLIKFLIENWIALAALVVSIFALFRSGS